MTDIEFKQKILLINQNINSSIAEDRDYFNANELLKTWSISEIEKSNLSFYKDKNPLISVNIGQNYSSNYNSVPEDYYLLEKETIALVNAFNNNGIVPFVGFYPFFDEKFNSVTFVNKLEKLLQTIVNQCKIKLVVKYDYISKDESYLAFLNQIKPNCLIYSSITEGTELEALNILDGFIDISENSINNMLELEESVSTKIDQKISKINDFFIKKPKIRTSKINHASSTVLLKNNDLLPLGKDTSIGVLGDKAACSFSHSKISYKKGYDAKGLLKQGLNLIESKDVILVLCKIDLEFSEPNQYCKELIQKVHDLGKKVIAAVEAPKSFDATFIDLCDAVILCNLDEITNLEEIILGESNPSGRLYECLPVNHYDIFAYNPLSYGYHQYEQKLDSLKFPFGYGLSYTNFNYSNFIYDENINSLKFTLSNSGMLSGSEIVQIYTGDSFEEKELCYFSKETIKPLVSKELTIDLADKHIYYIAKNSSDIVCCINLINSTVASFEDGNLISEEKIKRIPLEDDTLEDVAIKEDIKKDINTEFEPEESNQYNEVKLLDETEEIKDNTEVNEIDEAIENIDIDETDGTLENIDIDETDDTLENIDIDETDGTLENKEVLEDKVKEDNDASIDQKFDEISATNVSALDNGNVLEDKQSIGHIISKKLAYGILAFCDLIIILTFVLAYIQTKSKDRLYLVLIICTIIISIVIFFIIRRNYNNIKELDHIAKNFPIVDAKHDEILEEVIEETKDVETKRESITFDFDNVNVKLEYDDLNFEEIIKNLYQFIIDNQLLIDINQVRKIIASMTYSKIIFVDSDTEYVLDKLVSLISYYFGAEPNGLSVKDGDEIIDYFVDASTSQSRLNKKAKENNILNICYIKTNKENFKHTINDFIPYVIKGNNLKHNVDFSKNIWFFINAVGCDKKVYSEIIKSTGTYIKLDLKINLADVEEIVQKSVDYNKFNILCRNHQDTVYINEDVWHKLDLIEDYINERCIFKISNLVINAIEDIVKTLVEASVEVDVAFDMALAMKLSIIIDSLELDNDSKSELYRELENTFGYDNIINTIKALKEL